MPNSPNAETVKLRHDEGGHWVDWWDGEPLVSLGSYLDEETAEAVKVAKEREFNGNDRHIDDV